MNGQDPMDEAIVLDRRARSLPSGYQYTGFCGKGAQMRLLRQRFKRVQKLKDQPSLAALERLNQAVKDEPDPDFTRLHLAHVALQAAEDTGQTWAQCCVTMLDKFDEIEA